MRVLLSSFLGASARESESENHKKKSETSSPSWLWGGTRNLASPPSWWVGDQELGQVEEAKVTLWPLRQNPRRILGTSPFLDFDTGI